MHDAAPIFLNPPIRERKMGEIQIPENVGGVWGMLVFSIVTIGGGVAAALAWWRKNGINNADAGAHINSISSLQAILAAERDEHARDMASLRQENTMLRERADRFAAERNDLVLKFGEMAGELRAVRAELESVKSELAAMRGQNGA